MGGLNRSAILGVSHLGSGEQGTNLDGNAQRVLFEARHAMLNGLQIAAWRLRPLAPSPSSLRSPPRHHHAGLGERLQGPQERGVSTRERSQKKPRARWGASLAAAYGGVALEHFGPCLACWRFPRDSSWHLRHASRAD